MLAEKISINSVQLDGVRELIAERYGFWVKDEWCGQLEERIIGRMAAVGARTLGEYLREALHKRGRGDELARLSETILNHETSFFRTAPHFEALGKRVLPAIAQAQEAARIRIGCFGCSSGEEPYSLAMCALQVLPDARPETVEITGFDASSRVLELARRGLYRESSMRDVDPAGRERWFQRSNGGWQVKENVRRLVRFQQQNLLEPLTAAALDVILCRNVLIYFRPAVVSRVLQSFHCALGPRGYLFLGHSESAASHAKLFRAIREDETVFYQKVPRGVEEGGLIAPAPELDADAGQGTPI